MRRAQQVVLWDAINSVVAASGGNPGNTSVARQRAVVAFERVVAGIEDTIRHGARAACKRLRGERDEARAGYRWMVEHAADQKLDGYRELGARAAAAENERDTARQFFAEERETALEIRADLTTARLELRALEWLLIHHPDELRALVLADGSGRYSYCARALGWEG